MGKHDTQEARDAYPLGMGADVLLREAFDEVWHSLGTRFVASSDEEEGRRALAYLLVSLMRRGTRNPLELTRLSSTLLSTLFPDDERLR